MQLDPANLESARRDGLFLQLLRRGAHPSAVALALLKNESTTDWAAFTRGMLREHARTSQTRLVRNDGRTHTASTKVGEGWFAVFDETPASMLTHRAMIVLPTRDGLFVLTWIGSPADAHSL